MSPEIKLKGKTIAVVPDETGLYRTDNGLPIYINTDAIDAYNDIQRIVIEAQEVGGKREIGLTQEGIGSSLDPKRGDGKSPNIEVRLIDRPIRVSYSKQVDSHWHDSRDLAHPRGGQWITRIYKRTYHNPNWRNGYRGRR